MEKCDIHRRCQYIVKRKNRQCKMTVKEGQHYCGEHMIFDSSTNSDKNEEENKLKRVVCPNDSKHTVYVDKLQKHLRICNARSKTQPPYIIPNVNRGVIDERTEHRTLSDLSKEELTYLIEKIHQVHDKCVSSIRKQVLDHEILLEELKNPEYGPKKLKHLIQNASLLRHAEMAGFCEDETAFLEFGAGRGQMSYYIAQKMQNSKACVILLIDRANQKHKFDSKLKEFPLLQIQRIRSDIADLCLNFITTLQTVKRIVTVSKHLCGSATDYALRCIGESELPSVSYTGILISFCCHHRCDWGSYTGKNFMIQQGFTPEEFDVLCGIASWATSGFGRPENESSEDSSEDCPNSTSQCLSNFQDDDRKMIGRKVKAILNAGRQSYLKERGFICEQIEYVDEIISPENTCILARKVYFSN